MKNIFSFAFETCRLVCGDTNKLAAIITDAAPMLNFLIENTKGVLKEINNDKEIDISGYTTPNYNLTLSLTIPNSKYYLSAYSNIDDDMLWDELIEWVEDQDLSEKKGN